MNTVVLEGHKVGPGEPVFIIAEMSANHDGDLAQALALIDIAADAGADAIKLQTYTADSLTISSDHPSVRVDPIWGAKDLYELYNRGAMPMAFHQPLFDRARERGIVCFTTAYDPRDVDFLEDLGNPIYKIASFELVHLPLLRRVAATGKPIILSTGMADMREVGEAIETLTKAGATDICLLHCCSVYPAPVEQVNLASMDVLANTYPYPVGFSDHTEGTIVAAAAVARGARIIEKHFTNDRDRKGPDHRFSVTPPDLAEMVRNIRAVESAIGQQIKTMAAGEAENRAVGRRSIFAGVDIKAGQAISPDMLRIVRPAAGLHPRHFDEVVNRTAKRDIPRGWPVSWDDV